MKKATEKITNYLKNNDNSSELLSRISN